MSEQTNNSKNPIEDLNDNDTKRIKKTNKETDSNPDERTIKVDKEPEDEKVENKTTEIDKQNENSKTNNELIKNEKEPAKNIPESTTNTESNFKPEKNHDNNQKTDSNDNINNHTAINTATVQQQNPETSINHPNIERPLINRNTINLNNTNPTDGFIERLNYELNELLKSTENSMADVSLQPNDFGEKLAIFMRKFLSPSPKLLTEENISAILPELVDLLNISDKNRFNAKIYLNLYFPIQLDTNTKILKTINMYNNYHPSILQSFNLLKDIYTGIIYKNINMNQNTLRYEIHPINSLLTYKIFNNMDKKGMLSMEHKNILRHDTESVQTIYLKTIFTYISSLTRLYNTTQNDTNKEEDTENFNGSKDETLEEIDTKIDINNDNNKILYLINTIKVYTKYYIETLKYSYNMDLMSQNMVRELYNFLIRYLKMFDNNIVKHYNYKFYNVDTNIIHVVNEFIIKITKYIVKAIFFKKIFNIQVNNINSGPNILFINSIKSTIFYDILPYLLSTPIYLQDYLNDTYNFILFLSHYNIEFEYYFQELFMKKVLNVSFTVINKQNSISINHNTQEISYDKKLLNLIGDPFNLNSHIYHLKGLVIIARLSEKYIHNFNEFQNIFFLLKHFLQKTIVFENLEDSICINKNRQSKIINKENIIELIKEHFYTNYNSTDTLENINGVIYIDIKPFIQIISSIFQSISTLQTSTREMLLFNYEMLILLLQMLKNYIKRFYEDIFLLTIREHDITISIDKNIFNFLKNEMHRIENKTREDIFSEYLINFTSIFTTFSMLLSSFNLQKDFKTFCIKNNNINLCKILIEFYSILIEIVNVYYNNNSISTEDLLHNQCIDNELDVDKYKYINLYIILINTLSLLDTQSISNIIPDLLNILYLDNTSIILICMLMQTPSLNTVIHKYLSIKTLDNLKNIKYENINNILKQSPEYINYIQLNLFYVDILTIFINIDKNNIFIKGIINLIIESDDYTNEFYTYILKNIVNCKNSIININQQPINNIGNTNNCTNMQYDRDNSCFTCNNYYFNNINQLNNIEYDENLLLINSIRFNDYNNSINYIKIYKLYIKCIKKFVEDDLIYNTLIYSRIIETLTNINNFITNYKKIVNNKEREYLNTLEITENLIKKNKNSTTNVNNSVISNKFYEIYNDNINLYIKLIETMYEYSIKYPNNRNIDFIIHGIYIPIEIISSNINILTNNLNIKYIYIYFSFRSLLLNCYNFGLSTIKNALMNAENIKDIKNQYNNTSLDYFNLKEKISILFEFENLRKIINYIKNESVKEKFIIYLRDLYRPSNNSIYNINNLSKIMYYKNKDKKNELNLNNKSEYYNENILDICIYKLTGVLYLNSDLKSESNNINSLNYNIIISPSNININNNNIIINNLRYSNIIYNLDINSIDLNNTLENLNNNQCKDNINKNKKYYIDYIKNYLKYIITNIDKYNNIKDILSNIKKCFNTLILLNEINYITDIIKNIKYNKNIGIIYILYLLYIEDKELNIININNLYIIESIIYLLDNKYITYDNNNIFNKIDNYNIFNKINDNKIILKFIDTLIRNNKYNNTNKFYNNIIYKSIDYIILDNKNNLIELINNKDIINILYSNYSCYNFEDKYKLFTNKLFNNTSIECNNNIINCLLILNILLNNISNINNILFIIYYLINLSNINTNIINSNSNTNIDNISNNNTNIDNISNNNTSISNTDNINSIDIVDLINIVLNNINKIYELQYDSIEVIKFINNIYNNYKEYIKYIDSIKSILKIENDIFYSNIINSINYNTMNLKDVSILEYLNNNKNMNESNLNLYIGKLLIIYKEYYIINVHNIINFNNISRNELFDKFLLLNNNFNNKLYNRSKKLVLNIISNIKNNTIIYNMIINLINNILDNTIDILILKDIDFIYYIIKNNSNININLINNIKKYIINNIIKLDHLYNTIYNYNLKNNTIPIELNNYINLLDNDKIINRGIDLIKLYIKITLHNLVYNLIHNKDNNLINTIDIITDEFSNIIDISKNFIDNINIIFNYIINYKTSEDNKNFFILCYINALFKNYNSNYEIINDSIYFLFLNPNIILDSNLNNNNIIFDSNLNSSNIIFDSNKNNIIDSNKNNIIDSNNKNNIILDNYYDYMYNKSINNLNKENNNIKNIEYNLLNYKDYLNKIIINDYTYIILYYITNKNNLDIFSIDQHIFHNNKDIIIQSDNIYNNRNVIFKRNDLDNLLSRLINNLSIIFKLNNNINYIIDIFNNIINNIINILSNKNNNLKFLELFNNYKENIDKYKINSNINNLYNILNIINYLIKFIKIIYQPEKVYFKFDKLYENYLNLLLSNYIKNNNIINKINIDKYNLLNIRNNYSLINLNYIHFNKNLSYLNNNLLDKFDINNSNVDVLLFNNIIYSFLNNDILLNYIDKLPNNFIKYIKKLNINIILDIINIIEIKNKKNLSDFYLKEKNYIKFINLLLNIKINYYFIIYLKNNKSINKKNKNIKNKRNIKNIIFDDLLFKLNYIYIYNEHPNLIEKSINNNNTINNIFLINNSNTLLHSNIFLISDSNTNINIYYNRLNYKLSICYLIRNMLNSKFTYSKIIALKLYIIYKNNNLKILSKEEKDIFYTLIIKELFYVNKINIKYTINSIINSNTNSNTYTNNINNSNLSNNNYIINFIDILDIESDLVLNLLPSINERNLLIDIENFINLMLYENKKILYKKKLLLEILNNIKLENKDLNNLNIIESNIIKQLENLNTYINYIYNKYSTIFKYIISEYTLTYDFIRTLPYNIIYEVYISIKNNNILNNNINIIYINLYILESLMLSNHNLSNKSNSSNININILLDKNILIDIIKNINIIVNKNININEILNYIPNKLYNLNIIDSNNIINLDNSNIINLDKIDLMNLNISEFLKNLPSPYKYNNIINKLYILLLNELGYNKNRDKYYSYLSNTPIYNLSNIYNTNLNSISNLNNISNLSNKYLIEYYSINKLYNKIINNINNNNILDINYKILLNIYNNLNINKNILENKNKNILNKLDIYYKKCYNCYIFNTIPMPNFRFIDNFLLFINTECTYLRYKIYNLLINNYSIINILDTLIKFIIDNKKILDIQLNNKNNYGNHFYQIILYNLNNSNSNIFNSNELFIEYLKKDINYISYFIIILYLLNNLNNLNTNIFNNTNSNLFDKDTIYNEFIIYYRLYNNFPIYKLIILYTNTLTNLTNTNLNIFNTINNYLEIIIDYNINIYNNNSNILYYFKLINLSNNYNKSNNKNKIIIGLLMKQLGYNEISKNYIEKYLSNITLNSNTLNTNTLNSNINNLSIYNNILDNTYLSNSDNILFLDIYYIEEYLKIIKLIEYNPNNIFTINNNNINYNNINNILNKYNLNISNKYNLNISNKYNLNISNENNTLNNLIYKIEDSIDINNILNDILNNILNNNINIINLYILILNYNLINENFNTVDKYLKNIENIINVHAITNINIKNILNYIYIYYKILLNIYTNKKILDIKKILNNIFISILENNNNLNYYYILLSMLCNILGEYYYKNEYNFVIAENYYITSIKYNIKNFKSYYNLGKLLLFNLNLNSNSNILIKNNNYNISNNNYSNIYKNILISFLHSAEDPKYSKVSILYICNILLYKLIYIKKLNILELFIKRIVNLNINNFIIYYNKISNFLINLSNNLNLNSSILNIINLNSSINNTLDKLNNTLDKLKFTIEQINNILNNSNILNNINNNNNIYNIDTIKIFIIITILLNKEYKYFIYDKFKLLNLNNTINSNIYSISNSNINNINNIYNIGNLEYRFIRDAKQIYNIYNIIKNFIKEFNNNNISNNNNICNIIYLDKYNIPIPSNYIGYKNYYNNETIHKLKIYKNNLFNILEIISNKGNIYNYKIIPYNIINNNIYNNILFINNILEYINYTINKDNYININNININNIQNFITIDNLEVNSIKNIIEIKKLIPNYNISNSLYSSNISNSMMAHILKCGYIDGYLLECNFNLNSNSILDSNINLNSSIFNNSNVFNNNILSNSNVLDSNLNNILNNNLGIVIVNYVIFNYILYNNILNNNIKYKLELINLNNYINGNVRLTYEFSNISNTIDNLTNTITNRDNKDILDKNNILDNKDILDNNENSKICIANDIINNNNKNNNINNNKDIINKNKDIKNINKNKNINKKYNNILNNESIDNIIRDILNNLYIPVHLKKLLNKEELYSRTLNITYHLSSYYLNLCRGVPKNKRNSSIQNLSSLSFGDLNNINTRNFGDLNINTKNFGDFVVDNNSEMKILFEYFLDNNNNKNNNNNNTESVNKIYERFVEVCRRMNENCGKDFVDILYKHMNNK